MLRVVVFLYWPQVVELFFKWQGAHHSRASFSPLNSYLVSPKNALYSLPIIDARTPPVRGVHVHRHLASAQKVTEGELTAVR